MVSPVNVLMDIQETIAKSMLRFVTIQYVKMGVNAWKDLDSLFFVAVRKVGQVDCATKISMNASHHRVRTVVFALTFLLRTLVLVYLDILVKIAIKPSYRAKRILAKMMQYAYLKTSDQFVTVYQIIMVLYAN